MSSLSPEEESVKLTEERYNDLLDKEFRLRLLTGYSPNLGRPVWEESTPARTRCEPCGSSQFLIEIGERGEVKVVSRKRTERDVTEAFVHEVPEGKAFARATLSKSRAGRWVVTDEKDE